MNIVLLQTDIVWGQPQTNIERIEQLLPADATDLIVLPEMWATGFVTEPEGVAEEESLSTALAWMKRTAIGRDCAVSGSLAVKDQDGSYRNRHYFVTPQQCHYYDKRHLFTHGHEDRHYQAGQQPVIVEWRGIRFLLLTCYDLRFPVWSRYSDSLQYDAIIVVANWPQSRQNAWQILTRARAMENQAYLIGCNRVGDDHYSHYIGMSAIVSPIGKTLISCRPEIEETATFQLDPEVIRHQRTKFRVLDDRDIL
jgi:predicted amidohydrolase